MADENAQAAENAGGNKKGILENKFVMLAAILLVQGGMAFAAAKFFIAPASQPVTAETDAEGGEGEERVRGQLVSFEEMVVSLSSSGRARYLKTTIALEAENSKVAAEVEARMPELRDVAIMRLSSRTPDELRSTEGKEAVKAELKEALKSMLDDGEVLNVYYSDFVVQ